MSKKTDKLELNVSSGYGQDDEVENYKRIDEVLGLEGRTDDPDNPYPGARWFREDEGVIREAYLDTNGNVSKIDKRTIYDVASETIIEDFEGASISDFTTQDFGGDPQYAITDRGGDDWLEIRGADGDQGFVEVADTRKATVTQETTAVGVSASLVVGTPSNNVALRIRPANSVKNIFIENTDTGTEEEIEVSDASELYGDEIEVSVDAKQDPATAKVVTGSNEYSLSSPLPSGGVSESLSVGGWGMDLTSEESVFFNDVRQTDDEGQLSPPLEHSDLADAPESAHHTQPTDEEETFTVSGNTEEAITVTLSQAYKSGIANCGFTSGTNISPTNDADCYVQDYVTDGDGNITDVVVYAHNTTGSSLDIDVRFFGVPV